jgi:2-keto-3-deoxy-L-fuconate dehydrogenase
MAHSKFAIFCTQSSLGSDRTQSTQAHKLCSKELDLAEFNLNFQLDRKRAVVTGAGSGIGREIARQLASAGAEVVAVDLQTAGAESISAEIQRAGGRCSPVTCDVSDAESVKDVFANLDTVDILVNSAGIAHIGTICDTTPEEFDRLFRINVRGTYLCMQSAIQRMPSQSGAVILNLASIAATMGLSSRFAYSMTKGAVVAMTLSVAKDLLPLGIRCNCISPARVHTPFVDGFVGENYPGRESEMLAALASSQPLGRMGTPAEIAQLALYLCSDAASFITGSDVFIDGGFARLR